MLLPIVTALLCASILNAAPSPSLAYLSLLYQNNLNASDDANHISALLLGKLLLSDAQQLCSDLSESLLSQSELQSHTSDILPQLAYMAFKGAVSQSQAYWIDEGVVIYMANSTSLTYSDGSAFTGRRLPGLCTQSAMGSQPQDSSASASNEIEVTAGGNTYTGYRNKKSFRFLGIKYAAQPARFTSSKPVSATGYRLPATKFGSSCLQTTGGSEDCLFLNIQTPHLPQTDTVNGLRPILFWIHGGGLDHGSAAEPLTDGGNLASREDVVVVSINYRLGTPGFFAAPGTDATGNYGLGDQISALTWVINNIASFGGDSSKITIMGESAGGASVRALLGSPPAIGKYQNAIAMSSPGGGMDLGRSNNYGTDFSIYLTITEAFTSSGSAIFSQAGCSQGSVDDQLECLRNAPAKSLITPTNSNNIVQDGAIITSPHLSVSTPNSNTAHVNVIFGNAKNDGASFSGFSKNCGSEVACIAKNLDCSEVYAQGIIDSGLFGYDDTGSIPIDSFAVSQRVATDDTFRCVDQATAYAGAVSGAFQSAYYYQMDRTSAEGAYNPNKLDVSGPVQPNFPYGNPNLPYYRVHGADRPWVFGNIQTLRDPQDLYSMQLTVAYFMQFVRNGQPNPNEAYLSVRQYSDTRRGVRASSPWNKVQSTSGPIKLLDWPAKTSTFVDLNQCAYLNYSISYFLQGGT